MPYQMAEAKNFFTVRQLVDERSTNRAPGSVRSGARRPKSGPVSLGTCRLAVAQRPAFGHCEPAARRGSAAADRRHAEGTATRGRSEQRDVGSKALSLGAP